MDCFWVVFVTWFLNPHAQQIPALGIVIVKY